MRINNTHVLGHELMMEKIINQSDEIKKLEAENELLNKIKQNRNELIGMNLNLQKEIEKLSEKLKVATEALKHIYNHDECFNLTAATALQKISEPGDRNDHKVSDEAPTK